MEGKITYQVWVLGENEDEECTGLECCFYDAPGSDEGNFEKEEDAINFADSLDLDAILETLKKEGVTPTEEEAYLLLQVETVEDHGDWEENIETVHEETFVLKQL